MARITGRGYVYFVIHRAKDGASIFRKQEDYETYLKLLTEQSKLYKMDVLAYNLMKDRVEMVVVGREPWSLNRAIGRTHMLYSRTVRQQHEGAGELWANRFQSSVLDKPYRLPAVRYVETSPVRAKLVKRAEDWRWSSARAHVRRAADPLLSPEYPLNEEVKGWGTWLTSGASEPEYDELARNVSTGRPTGNPAFLAKIEAKIGRSLRPQKRGRKPGQKNAPKAEAKASPKKPAAAKKAAVKPQAKVVAKPKAAAKPKAVAKPKTAAKPKAAAASGSRKK